MAEASALAPRKTSWIPIYAGFVLTGMVTTLLGPLLPVIASLNGRRPTEIGSLFTAQFLSSTVSTLLSGVLTRRCGFRIPLVLGYTTMGVGVASLLLMPWPWVVCAVVLCGVGIGFTIPSSNLLISEVSAESSAAVSRLNACWAAGAILFPVIVATALRSDSLRTLMLWGGGILIAWSGWMALQNFSDSSSKAEEEAARDRLSSARFLVIFAALFFLYIGTENSISGWIAAYSRRMGMEQTWVLTPSLFWLCLIAGRLLAPALIRRSSERFLCAAGLVLSACGVAVLAGANSTALVAAGTALSGVGLSAVFPIFIASLSKALGREGRGASATTFAFGGLGGATLPLCVGMLGEASGRIGWGLMVPIAGSLVMLLLITAEWRRMATNIT